MIWVYLTGAGVVVGVAFMVVAMISTAIGATIGKRRGSSATLPEAVVALIMLVEASQKITYQLDHETPEASKFRSSLTDAERLIDG